MIEAPLPQNRQVFLSIVKQWMVVMFGLGNRPSGKRPLYTKSRLHFYKILSHKWLLQGCQGLLNPNLAFISLFEQSVTIYGLVFNFSFVLTAAISALNNVCVKKFIIFLFTLPDFTWTDPNLFFSENTRLRSVLHLCLPTQHQWIESTEKRH